MRLISLKIFFVLAIFCIGLDNSIASEVQTIEIETSDNPQYLPVYFTEVEVFNSNSKLFPLLHTVKVLQTSDKPGIDPLIIVGNNPPENSGEYASFLIKNIETSAILSQDPIKNITLTDFVSSRDPQSGIEYIVGTGFDGDSVLLVRNLPGTNIFDSLFLVKGEDNSGDGDWTGMVRFLAQSDYDMDGQQELFVYVSAGRDIYPRQLFCIELEPFQIEWSQMVSSVLASSAFYVCPDSINPNIIFTSYGPQNGAVDEYFDDQYGYLASIGAGGEVKYIYQTLANFGASVLAEIDSSKQQFCFYHNQPLGDLSAESAYDSSDHWISLLDQSGNITQTTKVPELIRSIWSMADGDEASSHIFTLSASGTILEYDSNLELVAMSQESNLNAFVGRIRIAENDGEILLFNTNQGLGFYNRDFDILAIYGNFGDYSAPLVSRNGEIELLVISGSRGAILKVNYRNYWQIFYKAFQEHQPPVLTVLFLLTIGLVVINSMRLRTSRKLIVREEMLSALFENMQDGFYRTDLTGLITWASPSCSRLLGFSDVQGMIGTYASDFYVDPDKRKKLTAELANYGSVTDWPVELKCHDGTLIVVSTNSNFFYDKKGKVAGIEGVFRDITQRREMERALKFSEEKYRSLVENVDAAISLITKEGKFEFINVVGASNFRQRPENIIGQTLYDLFPPQFAEQKAQIVQEVIRTQKEYSGEVETSILGQKMCFQIHVQIYYELKGPEPVAMVIAHDITERKRVEEALQGSEEKYRGIFDESIATVYIFDNEKNFIDSNLAGLDLLGYSKEELLTMSIPDVDAVPTEVIPAHKQLLAGDKLFNFEHQLKRKDGRIITVLNNSKPLTDAKGTVIGLQSTLIDITDRKEAEAKAREASHQLEHLVLSSSTVIYSCKVGGNWPATFITGNVESDWGYSVREFLKHDFWINHIHPEDKVHVLKGLDQLLVSGNNIYEYRFLMADGTYRWLSDEVRIVYDENGKPIECVGSCTDISKRKRAEKDLSHRVDIETLVASISTNFVSMSVDEIDEGITQALKLVGGFIKADRGYITRLVENDQHMHITHLWPNLYNPEIIKKVDSVRFDHMKWWSGKLHQFEVIALSSPSELPPEAKFEQELFAQYGTKAVLAVPLILQDQLIGALNFSCLKQERLWPEEDIRMLKVIGEILVNALEQKRKTEEVAKVNKERIDQERQIAGGFAHEIRNALFPARGLLDKLVKSIPEVNASDKNLIYSKMMDDSLTRAINIVGSILSYTRLGTQKAEELVLIQDTVKQVIESNRFLIDDSGIVIKVEGEANVAITANGSQFYMVINNLVLNAIEAMENIKSPELNISWLVDDNDMVKIVVKDNGLGMSEDVKDKIFKAFYSNKPDKGTGLGLATVMKIVTMYSGTIEVKSKLGNGTSFLLTFCKH